MPLSAGVVSMRPATICVVRWTGGQRPLKGVLKLPQSFAHSHQRIDIAGKRSKRAAHAAHGGSTPGANVMHSEEARRTDRH